MKKIKIPLPALIIGIILLVGGLVFVWKYADEESLLGLKNSKKAENLEKNSKDSDNDGLKDWEEELYRTNPFNPDSDGDGYLDGEEVDSGHNPLVKAPGDEIGFHPLPLGEKYNVTQKVLNKEALNNMFSSYMAQKGQYLKNHPEIQDPDQYLALTEPSTIEEITKRALADSYYDLVGINEQNISELTEIFDITVTDEQIKISEDNSEEAIKLYLSEIADWLNSDIFFFKDETLQIIVNAFENEDFSNLDKVIKINDIWVEKMKTINVPSSWKEIHKEGLRIIVLTRNIFVSLRDAQDDPLKAYYAVYELESLAGDWTELIKQAINLAESQEIELSF